MSERASTIAAIVILLLAGSAAWMAQARPALVPEPASLAQLPFVLGSYQGFDSPVGQNVEEMLQADFNVQREYIHPLGQVVWLYVGYYGTERGGTPEHTPRACYAAHDWSIVDEQTVVADPATGHTAVEYVVELRGQQQLVLFWYRSYRASGLHSTLALQLDHVVGKLRDGRGDGALVRLSTPLIGIDREAARGMLIAFSRQLESELGDVWPAEGAATPANAAAR
ncbi:MAG: exosortase C-terminal domain/associated protein EpsI [Myxococcota bacterium]